MTPSSQSMEPPGKPARFIVGIIVAAVTVFVCVGNPYCVFIVATALSYAINGAASTSFDFGAGFGNTGPPSDFGSAGDFSGGSIAAYNKFKAWFDRMVRTGGIIYETDEGSEVPDAVVVTAQRYHATSLWDLFASLLETADRALRTASSVDKALAAEDLLRAVRRQADIEGSSRFNFAANGKRMIQLFGRDPISCSAKEVFVFGAIGAVGGATVGAARGAYLWWESLVAANDVADSMAALHGAVGEVATGTMVGTPAGGWVGLGVGTIVCKAF